MKVDLASVVFGWDRVLGTLDHLVSKVEDKARSDGLAEEEILCWRLARDMFPLRSQVQFVCNLTQQWAAHAAGEDAPGSFEGDAGAADLRAAVAEARRFILALRREKFEGRESVELTVNLGTIEPTMPIGQWVLGFATTNILFHLSIAYAILRANGLDIGKSDLFAGGL